MPDKMIRVPEGLHIRLEQAKGTKSHADYIEAMFNYFVVLNINPYSMQTHPALVIKNDLEKLGAKIERGIAIVKAQEKDYFKPVAEAIKNGALKGGAEVVARDPEEEDNDVYVGRSLTVEELQILVQENETLRNDKERLEGEKSKLMGERDRWKEKAESTGGNVNSTIIRQSVEALEGKAQTVRLAEGFVQLPKDEFNAILKRIKDSCE